MYMYFAAVKLYRMHNEINDFVEVMLLERSIVSMTSAPLQRQFYSLSVLLSDFTWHNGQCVDRKSQPVIPCKASARHTSPCHIWPLTCWASGANCFNLAPLLFDFYHSHAVVVTSGMENPTFVRRFSPFFFTHSPATQLNSHSTW